MSRILKRPMFRRGGSTNTGIMSGLVDRRNYSTGKFGSMTEDEIRSNIDLLKGLQDQFAPLPKTRLPLGEVGLALASGAPIVDALGVGYRKFVSEDDKRRALAAKRDQAAVATVLGQAIKTPKDKRTTAQKNADVLEELGVFKTPEEKAKYIKAATIKTEAAASDLQSRGVVAGKGPRDKIIQNTSFVTEIGENLDKIDKMLEENPAISGLSGSVLRFGNQAISAAENFGMDKNVKNFLNKFGAKDRVLDTDIATLNALEDAVAPAYARILFPDAKTITNKMIDIARENIGITGFTGASEVRTRLKEIRRQFNEYIKNQNVLLGQETVESNIKNYKVVNGKLVEQ